MRRLSFMICSQCSPLWRGNCPGGELLSVSEDICLLVVRGDVHSYQTKSWLEILTRDKRATGRHQALRRRTDSLGGFCKDGTGPLELPGLSVTYYNSSYLLMSTFLWIDRSRLDLAIVKLLQGRLEKRDIHICSWRYSIRIRFALEL